MFSQIKNVLNNREEGQKGFSLVELAVVIVIIGILVAIAVPIFANMQSSATEATNKANAANGSSMIAAEIASKSTGSIDLTAAEDVLKKLEDNGKAVETVILVDGVKATDKALTLDNYCVQVGNASSGPDCPAPTA